MMKRLLCYGLISLGLLTSVTAQINLDPFRPGYVVKTEGDTLHGYLKLGNKVMKFKSVEESRMQKMSYGSLMAYSFDEDSAQYHNLSDGFYELVLNGPVKLYTKIVIRSSYNGQYTTTHRMVHYAVVRDIKEPITKLRVLGSYDRGRKYFRRAAAEYFSDCSDIVADIASGKYNKAETISGLVARYNDWLLAQSPN